MPVSDNLNLFVIGSIFAILGATFFGVKNILKFFAGLLREEEVKGGVSCADADAFIQSVQAEQKAQFLHIFLGPILMLNV